jgi:response regulator of citrate/malate metabolism
MTGILPEKEARDTVLPFWSFKPANNMVEIEQQTDPRITCAIIEKAALHRAVTKRFIERMPELELVWECEFQETAHPFFEQCIPDILFLQLRHNPVYVVPLLRPILAYHRGIIVTTGYYLNEIGDLPFPILAYLQKPFSFEQFMTAIEKYKRNRTKSHP